MENFGSVEPLKINAIISEIEEKGWNYEIPTFQRDYCWKKENIEELLTDLLSYQVNPNDDGYSLGTIVCEKRSDKDIYEILDGQQRLSTIFALLEELENKPNRFSILKRNKAAKEIVQRVLTEKVRKEGLSLSGLIETIKDHTSLTRVIIPLENKNSQESSRMFEIINTTGQRLTDVDILKAQMLSFLPESSSDDNINERNLFQYIWTHCQEWISTPKDFNKKNMEVKENNATDLYSILNSTQDANEKTIEESTDSSPIDMKNLLIVASWLFDRNIKKKSTGILSLNNSSLKDHFEWINQINSSNKPDTPETRKNIWSFLTIIFCIFVVLRRLVQYRTEEQPTEDIDLLTLTFQASSGFKFSGQYWLIVLVQEIINIVLEKNKKIPQTAEEFLGVMEKIEEIEEKRWETIRKIAFTNLTFYAINKSIQSEEKDNNDESQNLSTLLDKFKSNSFLIEDTLVELEKEILKTWNIDSPRWNFYFLDWLLSIDVMKGGFALKQTAHELEKNQEDESRKEVLTALKGFINSENTFKKYLEKMGTLQTVSRNALEHWLPREFTEPLEGEAKQKETDLRNGFGNLALIDDSTNSSLSNKIAEQKSKIVEKSSNPSPKLLWLAYFSQSFAANNPHSQLSGKHIPALTSFWAHFAKKTLAATLKVDGGAAQTSTPPQPLPH